MVLLPRLAAGGLLLLLALALDGKPTAPQLMQGQLRSEDHAAGGDGDSDQVAKLGDGCFGVKLDRIGTSSGLGCSGKPPPPPRRPS